MYILGPYKQTCTKYEISMIKPLARRLTDDNHNTNNTNDDKAPRTSHDYIGSLAYIPNEPINKQRNKYSIY